MRVCVCICMHMLRGCGGASKACKCSQPVIGAGYGSLGSSVMPTVAQLFNYHWVLYKV